MLPYAPSYVFGSSAKVLLFPEYTFSWHAKKRLKRLLPEST